MFPVTPIAGLLDGDGVFADTINYVGGKDPDQIADVQRPDEIHEDLAEALGVI